MTPNTILLATDLSARCDRALDRAVLLASEWNARLIVLHVIPDQLPPVTIPSWRRPADPREVARELISHDIRDASGITIDVKVEHGDPAAMVIEVARSSRADLVITAVARDEPLGRFTAGSVVEKLVRTLSVPLLVVRSRPAAPYRKAMVAIDFSEGSRDAIAATISLLPTVELSTFHAYDVTYEGFVTDKITARELVAEQAMAASRRFIDATPGTFGRTIETICEYGDTGSIPSLINDLVHRRSIDLVVLGTEGRTGISGMLLGSVARGLLGEIGTDVLLVRRTRDGST